MRIASLRLAKRTDYCTTPLETTDACGESIVLQWIWLYKKLVSILGERKSNSLRLIKEKFPIAETTFVPGLPTAAGGGRVAIASARSGRFSEQ